MGAVRTSIIRKTVRGRLTRWQAFLIAQLVKNLPAVQEILVRFLSQEDPLYKG